MRFVIVASLLISGLFSMPLQAQTTMGDYAIACNNCLSCHAISYTQLLDEPYHNVQIKRAAEANSLVSHFIYSWALRI